MEYGRRIVEQSLTLWSALTKVVEKDRMIADIVVGVKAPSEAWKILTSMADDEHNKRQITAEEKVRRAKYE